jgi:hypothetical protein
MASVTLNGHTLLMTASAMEHFGLRPGQPITTELHIEILQFNIAECKQKIIEMAEDELLSAEVIG